MSAVTVSKQPKVYATADETLALIEGSNFRSQAGALDVALLASILLTPDTVLWPSTRSLMSWRRVWTWPSAASSTDPILEPIT
jgi:hypothetical protein